MRVTGWTAATLRAQPARVIRAHFARIFADLVWSPELARAARSPAPDRSAYANIGEYAKARAAKSAAMDGLKTLEQALWPEDD
jgi:hypothetical protein